MSRHVIQGDVLAVLVVLIGILWAITSVATDSPNWLLSITLARVLGAAALGIFLITQLTS